MANKPELWKIHNLAKEYGKLPSDILELDWLDSWERYQFNSAVFSLGRKIENELAKNDQKKKGQRKNPEVIIQSILYPDPEQRNYANAGSLGLQARKPIPTVKVKPGMTPKDILKLKPEE